MREAGHSLRAIRNALGVAVTTVHRDLAGVPDGTTPERIAGKDGKSYPSRRPTVIAAKTKPRPTARSRGCGTGNADRGHFAAMTHSL
jgi:hypothetical protein